MYKSGNLLNIYFLIKAWGQNYRVFLKKTKQTEKQKTNKQKHNKRNAQKNPANNKTQQTALGNNSKASSPTFVTNPWSPGIATDL